MSTSMPALLLACGVSMFSLIDTSPAHAAKCADLVKLKLPDTEIKSADLVPAGQFAGRGNVKQVDLPAFCRVVASVHDAPDSEIGVEIWLPAGRWNRVFHGNGNGGFGGSLRAGYPGMEEGLRRGYASATTDTGTAPATVLNGDPLIGHPQKWKDWGLLSTHVMTITGKAIARAFYGEDIKHSYYTGCSTGGQQGLIEAQYYPDDYDGILIGAPVINRTGGHAAVLWDFLSAKRAPGRTLSVTKLALLHNAVLSACAGHSNGLSHDPFVSDPLTCKFDPATLTCKSAGSDTCLTQDEVQTAKDFYSGPVTRSGSPLYYGWLPGSEGASRNGWAFLEAPFNGEAAFDGLFKWAFGAGWDWRSFDFERDMPKVDAILAAAVNGATHGDLSRFRARGGKLIIYQGWADTLVAPGQTLDFYSRLNKEFGASTGDFARLFMAPGMMHCGGGSGPGAFNSANGGQPKPPYNDAQHDLFTGMIKWVEDGEAPSRVVATKYVGDAPVRGIALQRPLCAYPKRAWFKGSGDTNDAANFTCSVQNPFLAR
jgi:hypothetical protein